MQPLEDILGQTVTLTSGKYTYNINFGSKGILQYDQRESYFLGNYSGWSDCFKVAGFFGGGLCPGNVRRTVLLQLLEGQSSTMSITEPSE